MWFSKKRNSKHSDDRTVRQILAESIFEHTLTGCFYLKDGKVADCNKAMLDLVGGSREQVIGLSVEKFSPEFQPDGRNSGQAAQEIVGNLLKYREPIQFDWMHVRLDGTILPIFATIFLITIEGTDQIAVVWEDRREHFANQEKQKKLDEDVEFVRHSFSEALEAIKTGDLAVSLDKPFPTQYESIRKDFNDGIHGIKEAMRKISNNSEIVRNTSAEVSIATDDLARRTEEQAAGLEQTVATVSSITDNMKKIAAVTKTAQRTATSTRSSATISQDAIAKAIGAMGRIEQSSKMINTIIETINGISFQTNILALNAAVEAARAGEQGRGFSVVASEVRTLAQRAADESKNIQELISRSYAEINNGVKFVNDTERCIRDITSQVDELGSLIEDVSTSSQEQSSGLNEINSAMNEMDLITQKNAAMVEETTAAVHNLAREATSLRQIVNHFRIDETRPAFAA
ncbi:methyl-accepting chemotaxis protein [Gluconacetobacter takamatsuzukensis]|uniref:Methyl-accepting chemotaxis protein n=1 Tax=Gluconacetobacter takamatsuzukensis TaxID=1286190 RepID=A0A7W4KG50_9PROT|nr:methyl-accepting chemotaxis protein [Gluconacetobacter takamatsuzukensis]